MLLGLDFPPISHLTEWDGFAFDGTPFEFNKVTLIYIVAVGLTLWFFGAAARRAITRAARRAEHGRGERRLHQGQRHHADHRPGRDALPARS